jgi:thioredoxin 1
MLKFFPKAISGFQFALRNFGAVMSDIGNMEDFKTHVVESKLPVMIAFTAEWCGTCKAMKPQLAKTMEQLDGKMKMCKVDIDKFGELAEKFEVTLIPTVVFMKDGKVKDKLIGKFTEEKFKKAVEKTQL